MKYVNILIKAILSMLIVAVSGFTLAASTYTQVVVDQPYVDLRTGPGSAFPVIYSVRRGDKAQVLRERGEWYEIKAIGPDKIRGWVNVEDLMHTSVGKDSNGKKKYFSPRVNRFYEVGFAGGFLDDQGFSALRGGLHFTDKIGLELSRATIANNDNNASLISAGVIYQLGDPKVFKQRFVRTWNLTAGLGQFRWQEPEGADAGDLEKGEATGLSWYAGVNYDIELTTSLSFKTDLRYVNISYNDDAISEEKRGDLPEGGLEVIAGFSVYF